MGKTKSELAVVCTVGSEIEANILKSHLESEGIPAFVRKEDLISSVYGPTPGGLGQVSIVVLQENLEDAKQIIKPLEPEQEDEQGEQEEQEEETTRRKTLFSWLTVIVLVILFLTIVLTRIL